MRKNSTNIIVVLVAAAMLSGCISIKSIRPAHILETNDKHTEKISRIVDSDTIKAAEPVSFGYNLSFIGSIPDPDVKLGFRSDNVLIKREYNDKNEPEDYLLTYLGEEVFDEPFSEIEYYQYGAFAVRKNSNEINSMGLVAYDGKVLIPFDAAFIEKDPLDKGRYLSVTYSTGVTDIPEEALFYTSSRSSLSNAFFGTLDDDAVLHKGYFKVYDLENKRFVEGIEISDGKFRCLGDHFAVISSDESTSIYDAEGKVIFSSDKISLCGSNHVICYDNERYQICDHFGKILYSTANKLDIIPNSENYFEEIVYKSGDGLSYIVDCNGNRAVDEAFSIVKGFGGEVFSVEQNGINMLVKLDGTKLTASGPSDDVSYAYEDFGVWRYTNNSKNDYGIIDNNGKTINDLIYNYKLSYFRQNENTDHFVSVKDMVLKYEVKKGGTLFLYDGLVAFPKDGCFGVFDLITGRQILPFEFDYAAYAADYLYAYKNGAWHVFEVKFAKS